MITLTPCNSSWPQLFTAEKIKLESLFSDIAIWIEHIGSTAIPDIYAKPVIDILIGVNSLKNFTQEHVRRIESLGYQYISEFEATLPHRRYFLKNDVSGNRTHHIHLVHYPSAWWEKHILFRDYLRAHSKQAKSYEEHKLLLAQQFDSTLEYANAKTEFCHGIDKLAFYSDINRLFLQTARFNAYIPQLACLADYTAMMENSEFILCYGVAFNKEQIRERLVSDINHWDQHGFGPWMWYDKLNNDYVGRAGIKTYKEDVELTYAMRPEYWGKGVAQEMSLAAIDYAFKVVKDNLVCFTHEENHQSLRVMEKLGFHYEGDFIHADLLHKLHRLVKPTATKT